MSVYQKMSNDFKQAEIAAAVDRLRFRIENLARFGGGDEHDDIATLLKAYDAVRTLPAVIGDWSQRLVDAKARTIKRLFAAQRRMKMSADYRMSPLSLARCQENIKEMQGFMSRIDAQIAFMSQFRVAQTAGETLYEKRYPNQKFSELGAESKQLWEELALHTSK